MTITNTHRRLTISILLGLAMTMCLPAFFPLRESVSTYSNSILSFFTAIGAITLLFHCLPSIIHALKYQVTTALGASMFLVASLLTGHQLNTLGNIDFSNWYLWIAGIVGILYITPIILKTFYTIFHTLSLKSFAPGTEFTHTKYTFAFTWLGLLLCWLPTFLAFYPGAFVYDTQDVYLEVATRTFTTHHPLLYVLLLGGLVTFCNKFFDSYNMGIAVYTIIQLAILAGCFTYLLHVLHKYYVPRFLRIITFCYLGLFPVIPMYAVCSAKDTYFSAALLVVILLFLEQRLDSVQFWNLKRYPIAFSIASITMMLFRNNGVYAYVVLFLFLLVIELLLRYRQRKSSVSKRLLILMALSIIAYFTLTQLFIVALHADHSKKQELLTVPIQQLARTYHYNPSTFTTEQQNTLFEVLSEDALATYTPNLSDLLKSQFNNDVYTSNPEKYQSLWLAIGLKNPATYLNAWLLTSYGFWYPDAPNNVYAGHQRHTFQYGESSYFGFETEPPGYRDSKLPTLEKFYRKISLETYQQTVPVISMLFSQGFLCYCYVFIGAYCIYAKKYDAIEYLMLLFLLLGTVLLGPTYLPRYVLILWFALPVTFTLPIMTHTTQAHTPVVLYD